MRTVVFDTETTGLTMPSVSDMVKQPRVIELAMVVLDGNGIISEHEWLIYPEQEISEEITKITGITNEQLKDKPLFRAVLSEIEEAFADSEIAIAHNMPFDYSVMKYELERCARTGFPWPPMLFCTVQEYLHEFGHRPKLTELYERKLGLPLAQTHRALDDVKALVEILQKDDFFNMLGV